MHRLRERGCPEESQLGKTHWTTHNFTFSLFPSALTFCVWQFIAWIQTGDPLELMVQFFGKFGDKPCCITDLQIYLHLLSSEYRVQVRPWFLQCRWTTSSEVKGLDVKHIFLCNLSVHKPSEWSGSTQGAGRGGIHFSRGYQSATEAFVCVSAESSTWAATQSRCGGKTAAYHRTEGSLSSRPQVW